MKKNWLLVPFLILSCPLICNQPATAQGSDSRYHVGLTFTQFFLQDASENDSGRKLVDIEIHWGRYSALFQRSVAATARQDFFHTTRQLCRVE